MNDKFKIEGILASMSMDTSVISMNSPHYLCEPSLKTMSICSRVELNLMIITKLKSTFIPDEKYDLIIVIWNQAAFQIR